MRTIALLTHGTFWKKTPFNGFLIAAFILDLVTMSVILLVKGYLPPIVPLLYGRPSGESQLVPTLILLAAPALSIFFIIINWLITNLITDLFAKKLLIITTFLLSLLTSITVFKIIFLIGFF